MVYIVDMLLKGEQDRHGRGAVGHEISSDDDG